MMKKNESFEGYSYAKRKEEAKLLHVLFLKYQDCEFFELMVNVKNEFGKDIDFNYIKYLIKFMKNNISPDKGIEMYNIWCNSVKKYSMSKKLSLKMQNNN